MNVIVDIDGTVADCDHRLHFVKDLPEGQKADWQAYHMACPGDSPIQSVINVVSALWMAGHRIIYVTGRPEESRFNTTNWLNRVGCPPGALLMRRNGDFRPDYVVKERLLFQELGGPESVHLAIEDRQQVVDMLRRHGIRTLQCAEGDY